VSLETALDKLASGVRLCWNATSRTSIRTFGRIAEDVRTRGTSVSFSERTINRRSRESLKPRVDQGKFPSLNTMEGFIRKYEEMVTLRTVTITLENKSTLMRCKYFFLSVAYLLTNIEVILDNSCSFMLITDQLFIAK